MKATELYKSLLKEVQDDIVSKGQLPRDWDNPSELLSACIIAAANTNAIEESTKKICDAIRELKIQE